MGEEKSITPQKEWQYASWVSILGKWAWILGIINGLINIIWAVVTMIYLSSLWILVPNAYIPTWEIWNIIGGIIVILISLIIIKPKFSKPCGNKDWDALYNWTLNLGNLRLPWMLIWGILLEVFGWYGWGGLAVLIPAIMLLFLGPKRYNWSK